MSELSFIKTSAGLVPHTEHDKEIFNKWKLGGVISGEFKQVRNAKLHRKFFSLLNLSFDYWEPSGGVLTKRERDLSSKIFKVLDEFNGSNGFFIEWGRNFLQAEVSLRHSEFENIYKSFEVFRKWATKEAGFFEVHKTPSGTEEIAKSISFAKMEDLEFYELYKSVFNVCWKFVLSSSFNTEEEAQRAVDQMLSYT